MLNIKIARNITQFKDIALSCSLNIFQKVENTEENCKLHNFSLD